MDVDILIQTLRLKHELLIASATIKIIKNHCIKEDFHPLLCNKINKSKLIDGIKCDHMIAAA